MNKESDFIDNVSKQCFSSSTRAITKNIQEGDIVHTKEGVGVVLRVNIHSLSYLIQLSGTPKTEAVIRDIDEVRKI